MAVAPQSITAATSLGGILRDGLTRAHCQPIVDLDTGDVVAFEALARGPEGSSAPTSPAPSSPATSETTGRTSTGASSSCSPTSATS
jgi:EAL domain-containing protein (putative c-di-GMP-specific phosphodiesterase class I)